MSDFYNADIEENMRSPLAPQGGTCYILFSLKAEDSRLLLSAKQLFFIKNLRMREGWRIMEN